jgi:hypothetical protein
VTVGLTSSTSNEAWCATQRADALAVTAFAPVAATATCVMSSAARLERLPAVAFPDWAS